MLATRFLFQKYNISSIKHNLRHIINKRNLCTNKIQLDLNTNVAKDVIIYKYDNLKFFRTANIVAYAQFCFWTYLGKQTYEHLKDIPVSPDETIWWRKINLGDNFYRTVISGILVFVGTAILLGTWFYTMRSVSHIVLRKGGQDLTIVTLTPLTSQRMITTNIKNVSCRVNRQSGRPFLPLKIKGYNFHYMIDMKGEFRNPALFDNTAGVFRNIY